MLKRVIEKVIPAALPFVVGLSTYTVFGYSVFFVLGKEETHRFLNSFHTPYLDVAFKYVTHLGHGLIPILIFLLLLFVRYAWALGLGLSSVTMAIILRLLKQNVFTEDYRPAMFFRDDSLPLVDGIELMLYYSFPSGHSATAFCVCLMLSFFIRQKRVSIILAAVAILVAFSRVYVSQHFIQDTIIGSWIGFLVATVGYVFIVIPAEDNQGSRLNGRF